MTLDLSVHPIDACNVTVVSFIDIRSKEVAALRTHLQKFNITIPQNSINVSIFYRIFCHYFGPSELIYQIL